MIGILYIFTESGTNCGVLPVVSPPLENGVETTMVYATSL